MLDRLFAELGRLGLRRHLSLKSVADAARNRGDWIAAAQAYRNYLVIMPNDAAAHNDIGIVYCELGQYDAAQASFSRASELDPGLLSAHLNLGHLALQQRRAYRDAVIHYLAVLAIAPGQADARRQLAIAYYELGEVESAIQHLEPATSSADAVGTEYSLFITNALSHHDPQAHYEAHLRWAIPYDRKTLEVVRLTDRKKRKRDDKIRVGYVSGDFREHAVVRFLLPVLEKHRRSEFEVFCYANQLESDAVTHQIREMPVVWRGIFSQSDEMVADVVVQDQIDILIDLSGHTRGNRLGLFSLRPADLQGSWLGYLNTIGLSAMNFRLTDSRMDPAGVADRYHREELIRLDPASWCYRAPEDVPEVTAAPCETNGYVSFGSFNHVAKLNANVLDCWSRILALCPKSRLKLIGIPDDGATLQRLVEPFIRRGIAAERLQIRGRLSRKEFLLEIGRTDIALDPFPYCGGATTCESLWMGLPVIALSGDFGFSRSSSAIILQSGQEIGIADSEDRYVINAVKLAEDGVSTVRRSMRDRMRASELMNESGFIVRLEGAYRRLLDAS